MAALEGDASDLRSSNRGRPPGKGSTYDAMRGTEAAERYKANLLAEGLSPDDLLHNDELAPPAVEMQREKIIHRAMVMMHAQGKGNKEIAEAFGYSPGHVGMVLRQPWARQLLITTLTECGKDLVTEALAANALDSVLTLVEVRDNPKAKDSDRIAACRDLLDRHLGKPTQRVEVAKGLPSQVDISELDSELARLRDRQAQLLGSAAPRAEGE